MDKILDTAGQKGTGKWACVAALDEGVPLTLIGEAVFARCLSAMKEERVEASKELTKTTPRSRAIRAAFYRGYPQGFVRIQDHFLRAGVHPHARGRKDLRLEPQLWRYRFNVEGRLHHRSVFLGKIKEAYDKDPSFPTCCSTRIFKATIQSLVPAWRNVAATALRAGVPAPELCAALSYFDGYTSERLPANLLQAQRDYFGAHTYERVDRPRGQFFHTNWTGEGGSTTANAYTV